MMPYHIRLCLRTGRDLCSDLWREGMVNIFDEARIFEDCQHVIVACHHPGGPAIRQLKTIQWRSRAQILQDRKWLLFEFRRCKICYCIVWHALILSFFLHIESNKPQNNKLFLATSCCK